MTVHVERRDPDGAVTLVTLDRPDRRNALDHATLQAILDALATLPPGTRAVVLAGAGEHFCAGADLTSVEDEGFVALLRSVLVGLRTIPVPVVAAVEGAALGAGTQLVLACDLRVASPLASFGIPAARLGLTIDQWTAHQLALQLGGSTARGLLVGGEVLRGLELHQAGFIQRLAGGGAAHTDVPVLEAALGWAASLCELAPLTLAAHKQMLNATEPPLVADEGAEAARLRAWASEDLQEGLAAFRERRPPNFTGR